MRTKQIVFYILSVALLSVSCRKEVKNDFEDFSAMPVVNSILVAGEPVQVHLSLTAQINSNDFLLVENAKIFLYADNVFVEELSCTEKGIYRSNILVEPQKEYACKILIPDFDTLFCRSKIPATSRISNVKYIPAAGLDDEGLLHPALELTFENNLSQRLYYEVALRHLALGYEHHVFILPNNDPLIVREGVNNLAVFSNEGIAEPFYTLKLNIRPSSAFHLDDKLLVEFRSVDYAYYQYVKNRKLYEQGYYSDVFENYSPVALYSNVDNAYGIFAGYTFVKTDTIYIKKN
ncbi:MAG: DUF4249 domain-containing protein [Bacteroidales bacterium]|jgi:hypothetical protein|nr:DUF4249 domain-containing protein [Bacteroidales bacterium]